MEISPIIKHFEASECLLSGGRRCRRPSLANRPPLDGTAPPAQRKKELTKSENPEYTDSDSSAGCNFPEEEGEVKGCPTAVLELSYGHVTVFPALDS